MKIPYTNKLITPLSQNNICVVVIALILFASPAASLRVAGMILSVGIMVAGLLLACLFSLLDEPERGKTTAFSAIAASFAVLTASLWSY